MVGSKLAKLVFTHFRRKMHFCPGLTCRRGLIGAFTARPQAAGQGQQGLATAWEALHSCNNIDIK